MTATETTSEVEGAPRSRVLLLADDIWDMPDDGKRYEVIEGRLYVTTAPDLDHQEPSVALAAMIWTYLQEHPIGMLYTAPVGLILDEHNGLQPDLVFIPRERRAILTQWGIRGVPSLVVEILSPSTESTDRGAKWRRYAASGIEYYWIISPKLRTLEEHHLAGDGYELVRTYSVSDVFQPELFPGLDIPIARLWSY